MSPERFEHLLQLTGARLTKKDTRFRKAIPPGERLALTIRYLASGDSQVSLSFAFRVGTTTASDIISETCKVITEILKVDYLKAPSSQSDWLGIAQDFEEMWDMPNVIGALDG